MSNSVKKCPPGKWRASPILRRNLRDFPDKVIHDPDFLHLLAVHLLDLANQNPADEPVQHRLVQFLDGGIATDFLDKGADFAFLGVSPALHHRHVMQTLLVGFATLSLQNSDDVLTVKENLGHHSAAFTLNTYGHLTQAMRRDSAERMEKLIQTTVISKNA